MHWLERLLLYSVSLAFGGTLLLTSSEPATGSVPANLSAPESTGPSPSETYSQRTSTTDSPLPGLPQRSETAGDSSAARVAQTTAQATVDSLTLVDAAGQPRIVLEVQPNGQPQIQLRDAAGVPLVTLSSSDDSGVLMLQGPKQRARIGCNTDGSIALELSGGDGASTQIRIDADGQTEYRATSGKNGPENVLRTSRENGAEMTLQYGTTQNGVTFSVQPDGESSVGLRRIDGTVGPMMQLFPDGLGEISIGSRDSKSGPSMIRFPDGVAVMSVRRPDGSPGASMVASPDGASVIAAASADGTHRAALRVDARGKAEIVATDQEEQDKSGRPRGKVPPSKRSTDTNPNEL